MDLEPALPHHVPSDRVFDFDIYARESSVSNPLEFTKFLDEQKAPEIFYTQRNGGHWVFRRYDHVGAGYGDSDLFSTEKVNIPPLADMPLLLPQAIDPPKHQRYRRLLNPLFSPAAISKLQGWVRGITSALLDEIAPTGSCDFVEDFAAKLPTTVFLKLMGLPLGDLPQFLIWEHAQFRGPPQERPANYAAIVGYLTKFLQEKQKNPTDDIGSFLVTARDSDGELFKFDEVLSMSLLLFIAGLDTVTNTMSSIWLQLADDSNLRKQLIDRPQTRARDLDELLRLHSMANLVRGTKEDVEFHGVSLMKGDRVLLLTHRANRDAEHYHDPLDTLLERRPNDILTFGWGAHRCVGSLLARSEIEISLDEWFRRIPDFRMPPGARLAGFAGLVMGVSSLPLEWPTAAA